MGTGWEYFINVCRVLRAVIGVVGSVIGILVVGGVGWAIYQRFQPSDSVGLQVVAQPGGAPAVPTQAVNPQFKSLQTPASPGTSPAPAPGSAPPPNMKPNPQFKSTQPPPAPSTGSRMGADPYNPDQRPNPQFR